MKKPTLRNTATLIHRKWRRKWNLRITASEIEAPGYFNITKCKTLKATNLQIKSPKQNRRH